MEPRHRIILALDVSDREEAVDIIERFKDSVNVYKVGSELFTAVGPEIIEQINARGKKVFLDLKYHDIPNTVSRTASVAGRLGVFMFNVHTLGGLEMMEQASRIVVKESLKRNLERPRILGVTMLTSITQDMMTNELGIAVRMNTQVRHLAGLAMKAGLDGVVASPQDTEAIRSYCGPGFLIVTPGIRPSWTPPDDQKRTMTPKEALRRGADYIVIGRAVLSQPDPVRALERIMTELKAVN